MESEDEIVNAKTKLDAIKEVLDRTGLKAVEKKEEEREGKVIVIGGRERERSDLSEEKKKELIKLSAELLQEEERNSPVQKNARKLGEN